MSEDPTAQATPANVDELIERLTAQADSIGERLAERYREEIVEYRALPAGFIEQDVAPTARQNLLEMLSSLSEGGDIADERVDRFRESAVRRYHQGVPLQALLHAYRLWGHTVWQEVIAVAESMSDPYAALAVAGGVLKHVDLVSTAVAQAYLEEASGTTQDGEVLRRELLEALVAGAPVSARIQRQAGAVGIDLSAADHVVVLVRHKELSVSEPDSLRASLQVVRTVLGDGTIGSLLTGIRDEEIVAIQPVATLSRETVRSQADRLAQDLQAFVVGVGRAHGGAAGIARSYQEAQESVATALAVGPRPRAYVFSEALVGHLVRTSRFRKELLEETVLPLQTYDELHSAELIETLVAYVEARFNLTHTARALNVQPNTISYRLRRVRDLTGHDPADPEGLLLLALGLKARMAGASEGMPPD
ncbi:MAG: PucR family transcriptional regulator [Nocardioidaceae bacterium]